MSGPRIGSLFSGYGGLDMGVQAVIGGSVAWHVEYDAAPSKILEHHWPTVPNYGDVTTVDWAAVEPIDALTAGYPCQPFSMAGKRKGSTDDRHLWPYVLDAIRYLRPRIVVLENVRGHLSMGFDRVLGDLAEAGYDAEWVCLPASAAGAPHRRERIFIVANPRGGELQRWGGSRELGSTQAAREGVDGQRERVRDSSVGGSETLADTSGIGGHEGHDLAGQRGEGSDRSGVADERGSRSGAAQWGPYRPAIARWEGVTGRVAPAPTKPDGRDGSHRLSSEAVEFMMGLPAGHVTSIGLTRNEELKALGNGVVPQQAALAVGLLTHSNQPTEGE